MAKTTQIRPIHERYLYYKTKTFRFQEKFPWKRFLFVATKHNLSRMDLEEDTKNKASSVPFSLPRLAYFAILEK